MTKTKPIEKVSIIVSKGSLEGIYPALIMANGARAEGIEANLFFTFFGLDAIHSQAHRAHQARHRRQPRPAHGHHGRRPPRHVSGIATHMHGPEDGGARHPIRSPSSSR